MRAVGLRICAMVAITGFVAGCGGSSSPAGPGGGNPPPPPPSNTAPVATLSASPTSGEAPVSVSIQLTGTDTDGTVVSYQLDLDGNGSLETIRTSAIDTSIVLSAAITIRGKVVDNDNASSATVSRSISVTQPPVNQAPVAMISASPASGISPLDVRVQVGGTDADGTIAEYAADLDGNGSFETTKATAIDTTVTYTASTSVSGRVTDDDGAVSSVVSATITVTQPVVLTVHLRNLTQDGEPFVRGQGTIDFTVGGQVIQSQDSVVVALAPGTYEIFADHVGFYQPWGLIKEVGTGDFTYVEERHLADTNSMVDVSQDMTLHIYKILKDDIEGLGYTINDVWRIISSSGPGLGTTRFDTRTGLTAWIDTVGSDVAMPQGMKDIVLNYFTGTDDASINALYDDYFTTVTVQEGGSQPNQPYVRIRTLNNVGGGGGSHFEIVNAIGEIEWSAVQLEPGLVNDAGVLEELAQAVGQRRDLANGSLGNDILAPPNFNTYNDFGQRIGKILYNFGLRAEFPFN